MNRKLGVLGVVVGVALAGCSSASGPAACSALYNCCVNTYDPSSCQETATSETDASVCAAELAVDVQQGLCLPDGGPVPTVDASRPVDAGHG